MNQLSFLDLSKYTLNGFAYFEKSKNSLNDVAEIGF